MTALPPSLHRFFRFSETLIDILGDEDSPVKLSDKQREAIQTYDRELEDFLSDFLVSTDDDGQIPISSGSSHYEDLFGSGYDATGAWSPASPTSIWSGNDFTTESWMATKHTSTGWDLVFGFGDDIGYSAIYSYWDSGSPFGFHSVDLYADDGGGHAAEWQAVAQTDGTSAGTSSVLTMTSPGGSATLSADGSSGSLGIGGVTGQATPLLALSITGTRKHFFTETHAVLKAPASDPSSDLVNGSLTFWLNEVGNLLTIQVKYSGGGTKTGTVALV